MGVRRLHVTVSVIMSMDGCIDDTGPDRLLLSGPEDLDRVDALRAAADAILVGAGTVRRDRPRLVLRSAQRRRDRVASGRGDGPAKITITTTGGLDPEAEFFTLGEAAKIIYAAGEGYSRAARTLGSVAEIVDAGPIIEPAWLLDDLHTRGIRKLLVEGGTQVLSQLVAARLVDELWLGIAPVVVADPAAPRLLDHAAVSAGTWGLDLVDCSRAGHIAVLHYRRPQHETHAG